MGRIRTIKPEFFRSRSLARCSVEARLTFQGLWCEADDHGRGIAEPRILKGAIWPLDDEVTHIDVEKHLSELEETGHIVTYEVDGERYYEIVRWLENQAPAYRRGDAKHPARDGTIPREEKCKEVQDATVSVLDGIGGDRKGGEGKKRTPPKRGTRIAEDWEPSEATKQWARTEYRHHATWKTIEAFRDHYLSNGQTRLDWDRAFKNWVRKQAEWHPAPEDKGPGRTFL